MSQSDRARFTAFSILAAVAGLAAVGVAVLARAGICLHRLGWFGEADQQMMPPMAEMPGMSGMAMNGPMPPGTMCPVLVWASLVAAILCLFALVSLLVMRPRASSVALAAARFVVALRVGPLTALLCLGAGIPLTAATAVDGGFAGTGSLLGAVLLVGAAALSALALVGISRTVLGLARRLVVALVAAFRLLLPGDDVPWVGAYSPPLIPAGVRLARRRPSRAPPLR